MATITSSTYLDNGTARTAGEAMAIGNGAVFTIRTDTRIHANAPASFTGSLGNPTFTDIGGELSIDASAVRWLAYTGGSGVTPAIGTAITQGGVSGYFLGHWATMASAPTAVGGAVTATGYIKLREVTGGSYVDAVALGGITATASGADLPGWIECAWDAAVNFVVPRVGKFKTRGNWFELGTTNGTIAQQLQVPSTSAVATNNYCPGVWVEKYVGADAALGPIDGYEFWPGLSSAATGWVRTALGYAEGFTDKRAKFVRTFGSGIVQFGETVTLAATYATVAAQAGTYAGIALSATYTWAGDIVTVNTGTTAHLLDTDQQTGLDFTSGGGVDGLFTVTVLDAFNFTVPYVGTIAGGNVTVRPGVTITFTAHGLNQEEWTWCDFTTGTGVDGSYKVYSIDSANAYKVAYPHTAALTSGNVSCLHTVQLTANAHGHAIGNEVYCDFTSGAAVDGRFIMKAVATNTFNVNYVFTSAVTVTGNATLRWTVGYVPETGLKVKISNVLFSECATAARATNTVPNATVASRPEFTTTSAGAIDLEYLYALSLSSIFSQAYSIRMHHCAFQDTLNISECATALDLDNIGVGQYSAQAVNALAMTSNFAGGSVANLWAFRASIATSGHSSALASCFGQTLSNINSGVILYARSSGVAMSISTCQNLTFNGLRVFNGNVPVTTSVNVTLNDLDYVDRIVGHTSATTPYYAVTVAAGCNKVTVDGVTFGLGNTVEDCHPYTGILNYTGATNVKLRNAGSAASYLKTGIWAPNYAAMSVAVGSGGNNANVKQQKVFVGRLRAAPVATINSDKNVTTEQVLSSYPYVHGAKAVFLTSSAWLNGNLDGITSAGLNTGAQTSVYGTHWISMFQGGRYGALQLVMNEPTAETVNYYTNNAGVVKFNSAGGVEMRVIGATATWETPNFIQGHTGFRNLAATMSGGTIANYRFKYQIDLGSGWTALSAQLTAAALGTALSGHTLPSTGFKLRIQIETTTGNSTAITYLNLFTTTTTAAQNAIDYPLDINTVTFTGLPTGCDAVVLQAGTSVVIGQVDSIPSTTYSFQYSGAQNIDIGFIKPGYIPFYIRDLSLTLVDTVLPVSLTQDRNYS